MFSLLSPRDPRGNARWPRPFRAWLILALLLSGLPETLRVPVTSLDSGSPLTVAGAAPAWLGSAHRIPS